MSGMVSLDMKTAGKAALAGAAGAVVLIVANGMNYFVQDILLQALSMGWGIESTIAALGDFALYPLSIVVGLAIGMLTVSLCRQAALKLQQVVVLSAVSGLVLGFIGLFARIGYELVIRPILGGYTLSPLNALIVVLNSCTDIAMMTGLAIAGGTICAAFMLKQ